MFDYVKWLRLGGCFAFGLITLMLALCPPSAPVSTMGLAGIICLATACILGLCGKQ